MSWEVRVAERARKALRRAPNRRVGDWRILFDLYPDRRLVDILDIRRRTTTTYRE